MASPTKEKRSTSAYSALAEALVDAGVTIATGLPDDWMAPLLTALEQRPEVRLARVARESEIIGICAGAFLGGGVAVGVTGATGLYTTLCEVATLSLKQQIPMVLMVSARGDVRDRQAFQEVQGRTRQALLDAFELPSVSIDGAADLPVLRDVFVNARIQKRPYIVWIPRSYVEEES